MELQLREIKELLDKNHSNVSTLPEKDRSGHPTAVFTQMMSARWRVCRFCTALE